MKGTQSRDTMLLPSSQHMGLCTSGVTKHTAPSIRARAQFGSFSGGALTKQSMKKRSMCELRRSYLGLLIGTRTPILGGCRRVAEKHQATREGPRISNCGRNQRALPSTQAASRGSENRHRNKPASLTLGPCSSLRPEGWPGPGMDRGTHLTSHECTLSSLCSRPLMRWYTSTEPLLVPAGGERRQVWRWPGKNSTQNFRFMTFMRKPSFVAVASFCFSKCANIYLNYSKKGA